MVPIHVISSRTQVKQDTKTKVMCRFKNTCFSNTQFVCNTFCGFYKGHEIYYKVNLSTNRTSNYIVSKPFHFHTLITCVYVQNVYPNVFTFKTMLVIIPFFSYFSIVVFVTDFVYMCVLRVLDVQVL